MPDLSSDPLPSYVLPKHLSVSLLTFSRPSVGENFSNSSITLLYPLMAAFSKAVVPSFKKRGMS